MWTAFWGLAPTALACLLAALTVSDQHTHFLLISAAEGLGALSMAILLWTPAKAAFSWVRHIQFSKRYRLQWPIVRRRGWPFETDLASRIHHIRTLADFNMLQQDQVFRVTLTFLNSHPEPIDIEAISGHLDYDLLSEGPPSPPIGWLRSGPEEFIHGLALNEFEIALEQRVSLTLFPSFWSFSVEAK